MSDCETKISTKYTNGTTSKYLTSFQRKLLIVNLQKSLPESYRQRIEIMLLADEGKTQTQICQILGCCPATARHWTHIARTGMAHQWQDCPIGRPKAVSDEYLERLKELINSSPRDRGYSFRRWTTNWLGKHLAKEFGIEVSDRHLKRLLKQMGLSTRPKANNPQANSIEQATSSKILISDLKSANIQENSELLTINYKEFRSQESEFRMNSV
ncbi:MAG: transposase [Nostoc sp. EkiNYC01]|nr:helix-turn-helix domain-containing protein [Nostoc sp. EkiNYC01]